jgi:hypothetical protein
VNGFIKLRTTAPTGSIPAELDMFRAEVRFYREIAPHLSLRVPRCHDSSWDSGGTRLVLEDLSDWVPGADPTQVAVLLSDHHRRWAGVAEGRWPWLRRVGAAVDLIAALYDRTWAELAERSDLTPAVRRLGGSLVGRIPEAELAEAGADAPTLVHGDCSAGNLRTSPDGKIVFLDWEDVRLASGAVDLAWLLVSSVEPQRWDDVCARYGPCPDLVAVLPCAASQGLLSLADLDEGCEAAADLIDRLEAGATRLF